jgi:hypothetical protein
VRDLHEAAAAVPGKRWSDIDGGEVTLRFASPADTRPLRHLAELDSAQPPAGRALVAEVDGRLRAALPLDGGAPIADPFHRSAELIELLRVRSTQLGRAAGNAGP